MQNTRKLLGIWGRRQTSNELGVVLKNHRQEFLELCRRVNCDEVAANNLVSLVESYLNVNNFNSRAKPSQLQKAYFAESKIAETTKNIEKEINLIQLLAQLHHASLAGDEKKV